ncbi:non-ribosomal peptide synthetase [Agrilutibacter solisilvae]|uniref:Amino acid adenylation domain-containing protein n=1 Tax=Agrilutibacter solisilvae TaxID=2763317 RepID=A0A974Y1J7_9GAMM|nr:non-ribosomal peptide synthetase [Lysobacter solisilvae]QSX79619.1 amino acid adenylation domain-containing protein [Lysobacter solisilvae]
MEHKALNTLSIADKQRLLALARAKLTRQAATGNVIPRADRTAPLPLSWAQQRLWFLDQLDPAAGAAHHIPAAMRLRGPLDRAALRASLDRIVARHENLRTRFTSVDGAPQQVIAAEDTGFALVEHDLRALDDAARAAAVAELSVLEARAPFDLAAGPLVRGRLLWLSEHEHVLLATQHHIISDGWSTGVLVKEVAALYAAFSEGRADPLPPLPIQYVDYAAWQRQMLQGDVLAAHLDFWRSHLQGAPALLEVPTDRPRPPTQSHRGAREEVRLSSEFAAALRAFSQRHGVTVFMTLLASWSTLLSRLSGQGDVVIGTPVANRQSSQIEPLIGFFVNTLALRVGFDADPTVAELLAQVKATTLGAYAHQELPFDQVVDALQPVRSLSHNVLFQAMLVLNNTPDDGALGQLAGLSLSTIQVENSSAQFDLCLSLAEGANGLSGVLIYASDLFDAATITTMLQRWTRLLEAMVADDTQRVSRLPLLSAPEREQVLGAFNATDTTYPDATLIHSLIQAQVARQPDAIALEFDGQRLDYATLNRRANRLAHRLIAMGVQPDDRVAICVERGIGMVVGLLGVLKAGGAYVPLDPAYPDDRLAWMLGDSAPVALLTQSSLRDRLAAWAAVPTLELDGPDDASDAPDHNPEPAGHHPGQLAYVIYTSGSTGRPKGVMVEHRGLCNLATAQVRLFEVRPGSHVLQFASFSFDASISEIVMALCAGACLHLAPREALRPGAPLLATLRERHITHVTLPSSALQGFAVEDLADTGLTLILAGEALPPTARKWARGHRLFNAYGPTEATVCATAYVVPEEDTGAMSTSTIPIGAPIANTRIYILDPAGEPVPVGVAGELYIGGAGVARGYLNRPELTAERFVRDPFAPGNARMYRTGDLGRWRADGSIEYLGRNDFQVKLRGFRIELGEIEAQLLACEGVREAAVIAREDGGDRRLVAYLVAGGDVELSVPILRDRLASALPEHMVPSAFVRLEALPLTPNGKLDRRALPAPDHAAVASRAYEAPVGAIEQAIAAIWQDLLGLDRVGRHDHFFELGGHSLLVVRLVTRLRATLGVEIALRDVFAQPELAVLARMVSDARVVCESAIVPVDRSQPLPLSWAQQRLWFLDQLDHAASAAYHIPAALRLRGTLDRVALGKSLDRIVARHENLRTSFTSVEGEPRQLIAPADCGFTLIEHDLRGLDETRQPAAVAEMAASEARAPFDLSTGPLFRGRLLRLAEHEHVLLVTQHHIISDGWSIGVLTQEVGALYSAFCQGQDDPLPPLPVQYADYAAWQRQWLQGDTLQGQIDYWRDHLEGAPALLELPTDRPRPAARSYRGDGVPIRLSRELSAGLQGLSQRHGTTLFMTLLAGWSTLLSRLSGQHDVVIGSPVANRQRAEIEPLIGFFVNTLALRVDLADDPTVGGLLAQVRETTLGAYAHQDLPFEQVVEALQPERSLSHSPLFQVMLTLNHLTAAGESSLPDLSLSPIENAKHSAQFDLSLSMTETPDGLVGGLVFATDLFDRSTVERMAGHWMTLLAAMVADDSQQLSRLPLLCAAQREQVLHGFNATQTEFERDSTLHALFERQVERTPDAIALECDGQRVPYGELNTRANQVAHRLVELGVRPDDRVAICATRGVDMVVGMLAILKAGGGYVPLDPGYPLDRLAYMLADCTPVVVLTQAALRSEMPMLGALSVPVVLLDAEFPCRDGEATSSADASMNPCIDGLTSRHLAYVIYTSGSTGQPKGVMIEHFNAANLLAWAHASFTPEQLATTVMATSINFDLAVYELFVPLAIGATVRLVKDLVSAGPALAGATLVNTVPSAIAAVLATDGVPASVNTVNLAGEPLKRELVERVFASSQAQAVVNLYGPSETTTYSTWVSMPRAQGFVPHIGRPIANTQVYILDGAGAPVPVGVAGEIHIGGAGVARGYLNRADLTAQRFLADPFADDANARMYRTGDLGRWLVDGNIEYLGRNDFQVKIRGFRIEPGEIEARLARCTDVGEAVVIARDDANGDKRLVAYVVPTPGAAMSVPALRGELLQVLPEYMVPSAFVSLASLPLTPNGKLDRKALPAPDQDAVVSRAYEAPEGHVEQALAGIWQELLGLERVGRHDHFFELGGHSLLAVRLVTRVRSALGVDLALRDVFAQPTLAALAHAIVAGEASVQQAIPTADRSQPLPLSSAQQRLWFLDQLDHGAGAAYHIPAALRLRGVLDRQALQASLDRIVARHENLRTRFVGIEGAPHQVIAPEDAGFTLLEHDLRGLDDVARSAAVAELGASESRAPFDLATGPLVRGRLLRLAEDEHVLMVTQHHIVSDGWSTKLLVQEVSALYTAFSQGRDDPLPPLPIQYADYAAWQRQWVQGDVLGAQLEFWRRHLSGAPALLELPSDRARPPVQSHRGARAELHVPTALARGLRALSQRHGATLFMTLLAGWSALLSRLSGQLDVVIGSPVANRQRAEIEPLIGLFVNTLALRVDLRDSPTVAELLAQVRATTLAGQAHQDVPFEQVVEALQPPRSLSHTPVFQVMLAVNHGAAGAALDLPGLAMSAIESPGVSAKFDLSLTMTDTGEDLVGGLVYATDLFDHASVQRMLGHWLALLQGMVDDDTRAVARLPLLSVAERGQLLADFNATHLDVPHDALIHARFEAQAARTPEAIAVEYAGQRVSYCELNRRANRVAHRLIALGVKPDDRVALCVDRSIEMIVGVIGILKAGGAYVPLDPAYPLNRLAYMLGDSQPVAMLTRAHMGPLVQQLQDAGSASLPVLDLDEDVLLAAHPDTDPNVAALTAHHLAYVIYTSGSTGQPKGVMVEHASVLNLWAELERSVFGALDASARIGLNASLAFDASVQSLTQLLSGRTVVIVPQDVRADAAAFVALVARAGLAALDCTPAQLALLLAEGLAERTPALKAVLVGGEAIAPSLWQRLAGSHSPAFFNVYGPTECTVDSTIADLRDARPSDPPHIGRPVANARVHVLDVAGEPVPIGVTGEIHIGGAGLARGYLGRPDLTAERFVQDPFGTRRDARMYRTGDLARWRPDGTLEYLGRNDFQVKIRGFRIELGEIEAKLAACSGVGEVAVVAREDAAGGTRLVAYFTTDDADAEPSVAALRAHLLRELPEHMVPGAFVRLEKLPLTANAKIDRKALPAPDESSVASRAYEAPAGEVEQAIAAIWQDLLGLERIGRHDVFFELGGHSLLAIKVIHAIGTRLGVTVPLSALFSSPTVAGLATAISADDRRASLIVPLQTMPLQALPTGTPLFCLHPVGGQVNFYRPLARRLAGSMPVYGVQAREAMGAADGLTDLQAMALAYAAAIRATQPEGPYRLLGWSTGGLFAAAVANVLREQGEAVQYLGLVDTRSSFVQIPPTDEQALLRAAIVELHGAGFSLRDGASPAAPEFAPLLRMDFEEASPHLARWLQPAPDAAAFEHLKQQLPVTRRHMGVLERYAPQPMDVPVQVFWAGVRPSGGQPARDAAADGFTPAAATHVIQADHFGMLAEPHVGEVAALIEVFLQSAHAQPPVAARHAPAGHARPPQASPEQAGLEPAHTEVIW